MKSGQEPQLPHLGQFFRLFRVSRGLTLQQAAGELSVATLSRFERGALDLASDKALVLMQRLGVEPFDFFQYYQADPANYPLGMTPLIQTQETLAINAKQERYCQAQPKAHAMTTLAKQLFEAAAHWSDSHFQLPMATEQQIVDGFVAFNANDLFAVEWVKTLIAPASHELLVVLYHRVINLGMPFDAKQSQWLLLIWLGALMNHDLDLANQIKAELPADLDEDDDSALPTDNWSTWTFGQALSAYVQMPTPAHATQIEQLIKNFDEMGMPNVSQWYHGMYLHARAGRVHHNLLLIDRRQSPKASASLGALIQQRRTALGIRREDLNSYSSVSALWRFENDQTQLSFATLTKVMGQLAMLPSQANTLIDRNAITSKRRRLGLAQAFLQISRDPANAVQIIAQFKQDHVNQSSIVVAEELFVLRTKAQLPESGDKQFAQAVWARLLRTNMWYTLEMYLVEALTEWVSAPQLATLFQHGHRIWSQSCVLTGGNHFFSGLNQALARVVAQETSDVAQAWLSQLSWLLTMNSGASAQWLAIGSWYTAHYLLETTPKTQSALQSYLDRSKAVGYLSGPKWLLKIWQGQVDSVILK